MPARQGSELANKETYLNVSDRRLQVTLTPQAKTASSLFFSEAVFAFAGFISALSAVSQSAPRAPASWKTQEKSAGCAKEEE